MRLYISVGLSARPYNSFAVLWKPFRALVVFNVVSDRNIAKLSLSNEGKARLLFFKYLEIVKICFDVSDESVSRDIPGEAMISLNDL